MTDEARDAARAQARATADEIVSTWLDTWRGWISLLRRDAFVDLVERIAALNHLGVDLVAAGSANAAPAPPGGARPPAGGKGGST